MDFIFEKEKAIIEQRQMMEFSHKLEELIEEIPNCVAYSEVYDEVTEKNHLEKSEIYDSLNYAKLLIEDKMKNNREYLDKRFRIKLGF